MKFRVFFFIISCICLASCKKKEEEITSQNELNFTEITNDINLIINEENSKTDDFQLTENNISTETVINETSNNDFVLDLLPLQDDEWFQLVFLDYDKENSKRSSTYIVEKISNGIVEEYYNTNSGWGTCQLSMDKRKVLIKKNGNHDIYLLNGNTGTLEYKGTVNNTCCGSRNLDYLITSRWYDEKIGLSLLNLQTFDEEYHFFWKGQDERITSYIFLDYSEDRINSLLSDLSKSGFEISISDSEFDCIIFGFGDEGPKIYGFALFNVYTKEFEEYNYIFER